MTASLGNAALRTSSDDWTFWAFGGAYYAQCDNEPGPGTIDVDDLYMDSTQARVEICNAPPFWQAPIASYRFRTSGRTRPLRSRVLSAELSGQEQPTSTSSMPTAA
jgi:hypothetical protein